jgi:hypothetical protein
MLYLVGNKSDIYQSINQSCGLLEENPEILNSDAKKFAE